MLLLHYCTAIVFYLLLKAVRRWVQCAGLLGSTRWLGRTLLLLLVCMHWLVLKPSAQSCCLVLTITLPLLHFSAGGAAGAEPPGDSAAG